MSLALTDYRGLSVDDGAAISGDDHLRQSIRDLLGTPIGTRVMLRNYGSKIPELLDAPMSPGRLADIVAAAAEAIVDWEPRVVLRRVVVRELSAGAFGLDLIVELAGVTKTLPGVL